MLPMIMRKVIRIRGQTAVAKRTMESGVRVKPTSLKALSAEKMALGIVSLVQHTVGNQLTTSRR